MKSTLPSPTSVMFYKVSKIVVVVVVGAVAAAAKVVVAVAEEIVFSWS